VHLILSDVEEEIYRNVMRKDALATRLRTKLIEQVKDYERDELGMTQPLEQPYEESEFHGEGWRFLLGDSCERLKEIETDSVDLSVYSPPFADLFTYSASDRDLGNSKGWPQFFDHYAYIIREVLRVTKPGRLTCVHTSDIPAMQSRDGWIGIKDFPGEVINAYEREGWTFVGRAFVQKNPQAQAIRTKAKGLLFVQIRKDSADSRPALVDQILLFKAPGDNAVPVLPVANGELDNETWIEWANGIWLGISESDTLSYSAARDASDEKHICPLQLGTIERCIKLYSNPGELVLSPFAGIGSECYQAVRFGRRAIGIELKPSYAATAARNLAEAERAAHAPTLFDYQDVSA
jgi:DNA modification methylase